MNKFANSTVFRFLLVGIFNTLIGCGLMFSLYNLAGCSYWVSSAANYVVGSVVSFFLNKYYTFQRKGWSWKQAGKFVVNVAVCYLCAYVIAKPLVRALLSTQSIKIQENAAMLAGMCLYAGLNYLGQRFFAFQGEENPIDKGIS